MSFLCRVLSKEVYKNIVIDVAPHLHYPFSLLNFFRAHLLLLLWGIWGHNIRTYAHFENLIILTAFICDGKS